MRVVRIGLAQIAPRLGDVEGNLRLHRDAASTARARGAEVDAESLRHEPNESSEVEQSESVSPRASGES